MRARVPRRMVVVCALGLAASGAALAAVASGGDSMAPLPESALRPECDEEWSRYVACMLGGGVEGVDCIAPDCIAAKAVKLAANGASGAAPATP